MQPYLLLVEDDHLQAQLFLASLQERLALGYQFQVCPTESDFLRQLPGYIAQPPALAIVDIMVRWGDAPNPNQAAFDHAGFRCADALHEALPELPIIFHTFVQWGDAREEFSRRPWARHVPKEKNSPGLLLAVSVLLDVELRPAVSPPAA